MKKVPHRKPKAPMCKYLVGAPWKRMAIDILGYIPLTDNCNKYIMVVGDYFTKWMEAIPIPDAEAKTVADKFVERIVSIVGVPLQIHSDQWSNFESKVFKAFDLKTYLRSIWHIYSKSILVKFDGKVIFLQVKEIS
jgi:hypothetical protein